MTEQPEPYGEKRSPVDAAREERTLNRIAESAAELPQMMASLLRAWARREGLFTDERIMQRLGVDALGLRRLRLCTRPDGASAHFAAQLKQVADYTGIDDLLLANLVRQADAIEALGPRTIEETAGAPGRVGGSLPAARMMAAARDREAPAYKAREELHVYASKSLDSLPSPSADAAATTDDSAAGDDSAKGTVSSTQASTAAAKPPAESDAGEERASDAPDNPTPSESETGAPRKPDAPDS
jgi:hypothetical protein